MTNSSWCDLVLHESDGYPFFNTKLLQIFIDGIVCLFLTEYYSFSFKVCSLCAIFQQETIQYFRGDVEILAIWLIKLLNELFGTFGVLVLELRVDLEVTHEELVIALLQVLRQCILD